MSVSVCVCVCVEHESTHTHRAFCLAACESRDVGVEETEGERCGEKRRIIGDGGGESQGAGLMMRVLDDCYF